MPRLRRRETGLLADWIGATPFVGYRRGWHSARSGQALVLVRSYEADPVSRQRRASHRRSSLRSPGAVAAARELA
jgi:hypothetical protein